MVGRPRRSALGAIAAVTVVVGVLAGAPAALAADDCPNADARAQQTHASSLPHCFAYERVTPDQKFGAYVRADSPLTADGSAISVWGNAAFVGDETSGHQQLGTAHRGSDGWSMRFLSDSPEWGKVRVSTSLDGAWWFGLSEDYRSLIYRTTYPLDPGDQGGGPLLNTADLYLSKPDRTQVWITAPASGAVPTGAQAGNIPTFWRASPDLSRAVFDTTRVLDPDVDTTVRNHVWLFQDGQPVDVVDRLPNGAVSTGTQTGGSVVRVARDARRVVFVSNTLYGAAHVYARIDAGTPQAGTVLVSANADGTPCTVTPTFVNITEDGRYVRFTCAAALTPDAPPTGGTYIRDLDDGSVELDDSAVDRRSPAVINPVTTDWTRPEGTYRVRLQNSPSPARLIRTDLATGEEQCVSCPADGSAPTAGSSLGGNAPGISGGAGVTAYGAVSPEGDVVFQTTQRLVPEDTNAVVDVYLWKDGEHHLLSTGTAGGDAQLGGMSLDGSTVTLSTPSSLVPEDRDGGARDIYALVRGGGFLRAAAPGACTTDCQGPALPPGPLLHPLSIDALDAGNVVETETAPLRVSGTRTVRGTSLKLRARIPAGGRVTVSGSGLRATTRRLADATTATMTVRLSARSQRLLRTRASLRLRATVRYAPTSGAPQTQRVTLTFRRAATKKSAATRKAPPSRATASAQKGPR